MFILWCLFVLLSYEIATADADQSHSIFGRIQSGFKLAGQLLGLDKATEVAQLVSESFSKPHRKGESRGPTIFSKLLKLIGLESKKISAIAINALVFVAQLISTTLSRPQPSILTHGRSIRPGTPLDWILENPNSKIKELITLAKDPKLPEKIIEFLKDKSQGENTDCVQLLVCKTTPFLWGMQRALEDKETPNRSATGATRMMKYLPSRKEFVDFGDECEDQFRDCVLNY